jgi:hypothetical protein
MNAKAIAQLPGQRYKVKGNEPILLDDWQTVWLVESGSVALFAVTVNNGVIEGSRRYLFGAGSGNALFGTANSGDSRWQILAVPVGETQLLKVNQSCFQDLVASGDNRVVALVEVWSEQLGSAISGMAMPPIQVRVQEKGRFSLIDSQTFQSEPGAVVWVQIQQGNVRWMGFSELMLTPESGIFPLSDRMWLEAEGAVQLATETTIEIRNLDTLLSGLSQIHTQLLRCIDILEERSRAEELQRLQEQERLNRQVTAEALGELAQNFSSKVRLY